MRLQKFPLSSGFWVRLTYNTRQSLELNKKIWAGLIQDDFLRGFFIHTTVADWHDNPGRGPGMFEYALEEAEKVGKPVVLGVISDSYRRDMPDQTQVTLKKYWYSWPRDLRTFAYGAVDKEQALMPKLSKQRVRDVIVDCYKSAVELAGENQSFVGTTSVESTRIGKTGETRSQVRDGWLALNDEISAVLPKGCIHAEQYNWIPGLFSDDGYDYLRHEQLVLGRSKREKFAYSTPDLVPHIHGAKLSKNDITGVNIKAEQLVHTYDDVRNCVDRVPVIVEAQGTHLCQEVYDTGALGNLVGSMRPWAVVLTMSDYAGKQAKNPRKNNRRALDTSHIISTKEMVKEFGLPKFGQAPGWMVEDSSGDTASEDPVPTLIANDDVVVVRQGETTAIDVLANDRWSGLAKDQIDLFVLDGGNPVRDTVSATLIGEVTASSSDKVIMYTPKAGALGADTFYYMIDGARPGVQEKSGYVHVKVVPIDAPDPAPDPVIDVDILLDDRQSFRMDPPLELEIRENGSIIVRPV